MLWKSGAHANDVRAYDSERNFGGDEFQLAFVEMEHAHAAILATSQNASRGAF